MKKIKPVFSFKTFLGLTTGIILIGLSFSSFWQNKQLKLKPVGISHSPTSILALVTQVTDGDTIKVNAKDAKTTLNAKDAKNEKNEVLRIRYIGIDTPELGRGKTKDECFSQQAKEINKKLVLGKRVRLEFDTNEMDRFGRYLAYVYAKNAKETDAKDAEEIFVNKYLLEQGAGEFRLDTVNLKYQDILIKAAEKAHQEKEGLWSACAEDKKGCLIKGNLDKQDTRWYHLPYFRHYAQVVINLKSGDRWFCSEEQAIKAGFKKARE